MALEGLYIKVTHTGQATGPLLLTDVDSGFEFQGSAARVRRPGPVYIASGSTVTLAYSSSVVHSYESGCIKQWVDSGDLTVSLLRGATVVKTWLYDFADVGGAVGAVTLTNEAGTAFQLPATCIGVRGWIDVTTALTSGGAATIAVGTTADPDGFRTATAVATYADNAVLAFDGAQIANGTEAAAPAVTKFTAATNVTATIAAAAVTAGKFYVNIEILSSLE